MGLFTSVEISIGAGFGLFALFSVLRYRTETVPIREMTYLFVMVALPVLNSILLRTGAYAQLLLSDAVIILILWALEKGFGFRPELRRKQVVYEKIDLVRADRRAEMIADFISGPGWTSGRCESS